MNARMGWLLGAIALASCVGAGMPEPTAADAQGVPGLTTDDLANGRRLAISRCSVCHQAYTPETYPPQEWPRWVREMAEGAGLSPEQERQVTAYYVAMSKRLRGAAAP